MSKWWIALVVVSSACSSKGEADKSNTFVDEPDLEARAMLMAAEGGELVLDDGARVVVPAGALAEDAEVVLKRHCPAVLATAGFGGCRYEVSSDSALASRIEAELPTAADCVLAETDDGWRCLADSAVEGGAATATMSRFSALVSREGQEGFEDDTCTDLKFTPCGGELVGTWELVRGCGSRAQVTGSYSTRTDPYTSCGPDAVYRAYPYTVSGTLEFTEEIIEGTAFGYNETGAGEMFEHELVTEECLASVGESCNAICSSNGTVCNCLIEESSWNSAGGGSWEMIDGEVYLNGFTEFPLQYCVDGDSLVIERADPNGAYHMVYERR